MDLELRFNTKGVDWHDAAVIFEQAPLGSREPAILERAFANSDVVCFAWDGDKLVGMGRALSDGTIQAVIYDLCMLPRYQGKGLGSRMLEAIMDKAGVPNVVLWSVPGKEGFYERFGFRTMRTAMARFATPETSIENGYII